MGAVTILVLSLSISILIADNWRLRKDIAKCLGILGNTQAKCITAEERLSVLEEENDLLLKQKLTQNQPKTHTRTYTGAQLRRLNEQANARALEEEN
jgi:hypothetical protein